MHNHHFLLVIHLLYEDQNNVAAPARKEFTYVRYAEVAENEFFSTTEKGISAMDNLKNVMINQYP